MLVVVPVWNEEANQDPEFKNTFIEVLCPVKMAICEFQYEDGLRIFVNAMKHHAQDSPQESKKPVRSVSGAY